MAPDTKEEFEQFGTALMQKIMQFNKHAEFPQFAEDLIKYIALNCKYIRECFMFSYKNIIFNLFL